MRHIKKCSMCKKYTMLETCSCGNTTFIPKPPKFSPEDKYGKYRREVKRTELEKKGLL